MLHLWVKGGKRRVPHIEGDNGRLVCVLGICDSALTALRKRESYFEHRIKKPLIRKEQNKAICESLVVNYINRYSVSRRQSMRRTFLETDSPMPIDTIRTK